MFTGFVNLPDVLKNIEYDSIPFQCELNTEQIKAFEEIISCNQIIVADKFPISQGEDYVYVDVMFRRTSFAGFSSISAFIIEMMLSISYSKINDELYHFDINRLDD